MKKFYLFFILFAVSTLACSASTPAANSPAPEYPVAAQVNAQAVALPTAQPRAYAVGKVYVRSCASTSCDALGWYESGGVVALTGAEVFDAESTECKQWYGVNFNGQRGWVCAAWIAR